jgi:inhibitor of KinA sporulation pathway (predicted exonuclease)
VNLAFQGTEHRGIDDARNIARLLPYALGRLPVPSIERTRAF